MDTRDLTPQQASAPYTMRDVLLWCGGGLFLLSVALLPVLRPAYFKAPLFVAPTALLGAKLFLAALFPFVTWLSVRTIDGHAELKWTLWALALGLAGLCEIVHVYMVDGGRYFAPPYPWSSNTEWQLWMHPQVVGLDPQAIPHSYRFLPNCIVELFRWLTGDFVYARIVYRLAANAVLFVVLFRFARAYVSSLAAILLVLLVVLVYPVSVLHYAGQFVDPLSHLSFALCFFALRSGYEPAFAPSMLVGIFAKESVAVMALCRAVFGPNRTRAVLLSALYMVAAVAVVAGIRLKVNGGTFSYGNVSGVQPGHIWTNLGRYREWAPLYLFTIGVFVPGTVLGFRHVDFALRASCVIVLFGVIASSAVFSWLVEVRNLMPAVFAMALINVRYVEVRLAAHGIHLRPSGW